MKPLSVQPFMRENARSSCAGSMPTDCGLVKLVPDIVGKTFLSRLSLYFMARCNWGNYCDQAKLRLYLRRRKGPTECPSVSLAHLQEARSGAERRVRILEIPYTRVTSAVGCRLRGTARPNRKGSNRRFKLDTVRKGHMVHLRQFEYITSL